MGSAYPLPDYLSRHAVGDHTLHRPVSYINAAGFLLSKIFADNDDGVPVPRGANVDAGVGTAYT